MKRIVTIGAIHVLLIGTLGMSGCPLFMPESTDDGPIAKDIQAKLGDPVPYATAEQLATFERGKEVSLKRFDLSDGVGPAFNVTFCAACHERPVPGGAAALYRNFFLAGRRTNDGAFLFVDSAGPAGGVIRGLSEDANDPFRPTVPENATIFAQRNPIAMFGVGLLAELSEEEILKRADPNDADGDGISGRPNFDRGFVGRFGRKSQTVSIEGFIRGPLFNHLGVTTVPLTDEQRAKLPVDSSTASAAGAKSVQGLPDFLLPAEKLGPHSQAAAPDAPNFDDDGIADPEMTGQELFDLISFSMLLAPPEFEPLTEQTNNGRLLFHQANCSACHTPRLDGPRGPIPAYSDLLLHDMGPDLADGIVMKEASGSEFRTQPLWGIGAVGPYLHDGRASTIEEAILAHGGEAQAARDAFAAFSEQERDDVLEFLLSLGGRDQTTGGLLPPNAPVPDVGDYAGPRRDLTDREADRFIAGRALFDRDFGFSEGIGGLTGADKIGRFNGDSCRACHFDPVIGGAGPRDVNVMRCGTMDEVGDFFAPTDTPNTILHRHIRIGGNSIGAAEGINVFEHRQTPALFGLGLVESISKETILANADPNDADADGISGRAHVLPDGRIGRLGWKAQVPDIAEFIRDAMAAELGLTLPEQPGLTFGITTDTDDVPDPELSVDEAEDIAFFMRMLAPPPRQASADSAEALRGEELFATVGCTKCHIPSLTGDLGEARLYSDLLLHEVMDAPRVGIVDGFAGIHEFRTAPLWGVSQTAPYLHDGSADTLNEAIRGHQGEATAAADAYRALSTADRLALLAFLESL